MNEARRSLLFVAVLVAAIVATYVFSVKPYISLENRVHHVLTENSTWTVTMQAYRPNGVIAAETYRLHNDNGKTSMYYAATDRAGDIKYFNVPLEGPGGTFLFQELEGDGLWELDDKAVRPNPVDEYIIVVQQTLGDQGGQRSFGFSDPQYWATTNAREFKLELPPKGAGPSASFLPVAGGRPLRDDRYLKIVRAIRAFGPPSVQQAESQIRAEIMAGIKRAAASGH